jgi:hypothetical protein
MHLMKRFGFYRLKHSYGFQLLVTNGPWTVQAQVWDVSLWFILRLTDHQITYHPYAGSKRRCTLKTDDGVCRLKRSQHLPEPEPPF